MSDTGVGTLRLCPTFGAGANDPDIIVGHGAATATNLRVSARPGGAVLSSASALLTRGILVAARPSDGVRFPRLPGQLFRHGHGFAVLSGGTAWTFVTALRW